MIMSQALTTIPSFSSLRTSSSSSSSSKIVGRIPSSCCLKVEMSRNDASFDAPTTNIALSPVSRRNMIALGIGSAVLGLSNGEKNNSARAFPAMKPPASPTDQERFDPSASDVVKDKVQDTKNKIGDAMKQAIGKKDEIGKKIGDSSGKVQEKIESKIGQSSLKNFQDKSPIKKVKENLPDDSFPPTESERQP